MPTTPTPAPEEGQPESAITYFDWEGHPAYVVGDLEDRSSPSKVFVGGAWQGIARYKLTHHATPIDEQEFHELLRERIDLSRQGG